MSPTSDTESEHSSGMERPRQAAGPVVLVLGLVAFMAVAGATTYFLVADYQGAHSSSSAQSSSTGSCQGYDCPEHSGSTGSDNARGEAALAPSLVHLG